MRFLDIIADKRDYLNDLIHASYKDLMAKEQVPRLKWDTEGTYLMYLTRKIEIKNPQDPDGLIFIWRAQVYDLGNKKEIGPREFFMPAALEDQLREAGVDEGDTVFLKYFGKYKSATSNRPYKHFIVRKL